MKCRCLCYEDAAMEIGDKWLAYIFDLSAVQSIKLASEKKEDFTYKKTNLFFGSGAEATEDIPFEKMCLIWEEFLNTPRIDFSKQ